MRTEHIINIEVNLNEEKYKKLKAIYENHKEITEKHLENRLDFEEYVVYGLISKENAILDLLFNNHNMVCAVEENYKL